MKSVASHYSLTTHRTFFLFLILAIGSCSLAFCAEGQIEFEQKEGNLQLKIDGHEVASFVFKDDKVGRPYFAHVKTRSGKQVTRRYPPEKGLDKTDHPDMHPGIWLSFGSLNGHDYWRLKAKTEHVRFVEPPSIRTISDKTMLGSFSVLNHYLATDSKEVVCSETCSYLLTLTNTGYVLTMSSEFSSKSGDITFGDQEEMGLGIRLATPIAVESKLGGQILDSEGRKNGAEIWGKQAKWCDYSGMLEGSWAGITVYGSPKNFRLSWVHARDYGLVAMNPFGLNAFTKAPRQDIVIKQGDVMKLEYAVTVHETAVREDYDAKSASPYRE